MEINAQGVMVFIAMEPQSEGGITSFHLLHDIG